MFQIYRFCPIRDGFDAIRGETADALPMVYHSHRLAEKLAARLERAADPMGLGDEYMRAAPAGRPFDPPAVPPANWGECAGFVDLPF